MKKYLLLFILFALPAVGCAIFAAAEKYEVLLGRLIAAVAAVFLIYAARRGINFPPLRTASGIVIGWAYWLLCMLELSSFFMSGGSFDRKYFYHFNFGSIRYAPLLLQVWTLAGIIFLLAGFYLIYRTLKRSKPRGDNWQKKVLFAGTLLAALDIVGVFSPAGNLLRAVWKLKKESAQSDTVVVIPDKYAEFGLKECMIERNEVVVSPGKNLIFILLESLESTFFDENIFPGLLPNLQKLRSEEAYNFTNVKSPANAEFTFGAMYSMFFGSILCNSQLIGFGNLGNDGINVALGNRLSSFPSILNRAGYYQVFMRGPPLEFGGTNILLKNEKYDEMWSGDAANLNILGWETDKWGCHDDELFERAFGKYQELCRRKQPFNLTLLTVNGHNPRGFCSPSADPYTGWEKELKLLTANHATDAALGRFIGRLKETPEWKDTVVVFSTDHPALHCSVSDVLYANPKRKLVVGALNSTAGKGENHTPGRSFDLAPTILSLIGVKHNYVFPLGENLLHPCNGKRLLADRPAGFAVLESYVKKRSWISPGSSFSVRAVKSGPPALLLGKLELPVFAANWGIQSWPDDRECFIVRLTKENEIIDYYTKELSDVESINTNSMNYLILGTSKGILPALLENGNYKSKNYILAYGDSGGWHGVGAARIEDIFLKVNNGKNGNGRNEPAAKVEF